MSELHNDDAWLSAFEGRRSGGDTSIRHAEQLRDYYTKRSTLELDETLDDASYNRTMNYLRAQGAFRPRTPAPAASSAKSSVWRSVHHWLFPMEGGSGNRYALVAGLVIAVMAVPVVVTQMGGDDEPWSADEAPAGIFTGPSTKTPPIPKGSGAAKGLPPLHHNDEANMLLSNDPAQLAREIQSALMSRGVVAHMGTSNVGSTLAADIAPSQLPQVQQDLLVYGIQVPSNGQLRLSMRKP